MEIAGIPLRDIILVASGLAGIYLVLMVLRLFQIGRHKSVTPAFESDESNPWPPPDEGSEEAEAEPVDEEEAYVYAKPRPVAAVITPTFGAELEKSHLEREVKQLRDEVVALRDELAQVRAASRVSPQYADAMSLAQRGLTAQDVADRCGISLAEAELVWALARSTQNLNEEDNYGAEPGRTHTRF